MYTKTAVAGSLAVTPGITYAQTGSIIAAGAALLIVGGAFVFAARKRRKHDDDIMGR